MKTLTFKVQGMTCVVCSGTVEKALKALPSAEGVAVNFASGKAVITFDEKLLSEADIAAAVTRAGYKPVIGEVAVENKRDFAQIRLMVSFVLGLALLLWAMLPMAGVPYPAAISPDEGTLAFATVQLILCLPVPALNVYTNLYLRFKVARVLAVDLGGDLRYFTKYAAPDYSPALGQYTIQDNGAANVETGNYPIVNVYANMHLKHTRFFVMMSHVNASAGGERFLTPHYPINGRIFRFGVSWNFFN